MRLLVSLLACLVIGDAHAYLDPGTGSMLLQVILGGVAAIAVAVKLYWYRILEVLGIRKRVQTEDDAG